MDACSLCVSCLTAHWSPAGRNRGCGWILGAALLERQVSLTFILLSIRWDMQLPVGGSKYQFLIVFSSGHHFGALLYCTVCNVCACVFVHVCKIWAVQQEVPSSLFDPWRSPGSLQHPESLPGAGEKGAEGRRGGAAAVRKHLLTLLSQ